MPDLKEALGPKTESVFILGREFISAGLSYNVLKEDSVILADQGEWGMEDIHIRIS